MATLLEVGQLADDADFKVRVKGALLVLCGEIGIEDPGTTDHDRRLTWSMQTIQNLDYMLGRMFPSICSLPEVQDDLEAIDDADLMTAVNVVLPYALPPA